MIDLEKLSQAAKIFAEQYGKNEGVFGLSPTGIHLSTSSLFEEAEKNQVTVILDQQYDGLICGHRVIEHHFCLHGIQFYSIETEEENNERNK